MDYTNVLDCVVMMLEVEDPESPLDNMNVSVRRSTGQYIMEEAQFKYASTQTGKVRLTNRCAYYRTHCVHPFPHAGTISVR